MFSHANQLTCLIDHLQFRHGTSLLQVDGLYAIGISQGVTDKRSLEKANPVISK